MKKQANKRLETHMQRHSTAPPIMRGGGSMHGSVQRSTRLRTELAIHIARAVAAAAGHVVTPLITLLVPSDDEFQKGGREGGSHRQHRTGFVTDSELEKKIDSEIFGNIRNGCCQFLKGSGCTLLMLGGLWMDAVDHPQISCPNPILKLTPFKHISKQIGPTQPLCHLSRAPEVRVEGVDPQRTLLGLKSGGGMWWHP